MFSRIRAALARRIEPIIRRQHAKVVEADRRWREISNGTRPYLVECPYCDVATMSQAAMNEHLRVQHGDS